MAIAPLTDRILIIADPMETTTANGIILPGIVKETPKTGVVKAIGPKVHDIEVGDHILFTEWAGATVFDDDGTELIIFEQEHVLAVLGDDG